MQVSAEIRWFWKNALPPLIEDWFRRRDKEGCPADGGRLRLDEYLRDQTQAELGVKRRAGKKGVEVKGLVDREVQKLNAAPFTGPVEIWAKWTSEALEVDSGTAVKTIKRRWLRKFSTA